MSSVLFIIFYHREALSGRESDNTEGQKIERSIVFLGETKEEAKELEASLKKNLKNFLIKYTNFLNL